MKKLLELRGHLDKKTSTIIEIVGFVLIMSIWSFLTAKHLIPSSILPAPWKVLASFKELHFDDALVLNAFYSIKLNLYGYLGATAAAILLGFPIGLYPIVRSLSSKYIDASRFIPLTAVTGIFIAWFGIETTMKVLFLAFGIFVYLLPVVVQRIDECNETYIQTAQTIGATKWQLISTIIFPEVMHKLSDDIRVLVAISWTYIIVAEMVNKSGGIGALVFASARQSRMDKVFAVLLVIILIGFVQDRLFKLADRMLFPSKHVRK
jgi:NitT/TauT family transport system permease protein